MVKWNKKENFLSSFPFTFKEKIMIAITFISFYIKNC